MYNQITLQIRIDNLLTPSLKSFCGLRQGDNLSSTLFNIFTYDLPNCLKNCAPAICNGIPIHCLLYADDLIIFSESIEGMQKAIDPLKCYCSTWKLDTNIDKTKIMCINYSLKNTSFKYNNISLELVNEHCYLGIIFTDKCTFHAAVESLYKKGLKALFKLLNFLKPLPSAKTILHLFDHLVKPIMLYGCEIWGPCRINNGPS
jgi:hypothetical protein